jgi:malate dehydrogenase (oxaloacetate-decarboxylating)(NADP+)
MSTYRAQLSARLDPTMASLTAIFEVVRTIPQRVVFAEGEDDKCIRAAVAFYNAGYGTPVLVGRENRIRETIKTLGIADLKGIEIDNAALNDRTAKYADFLYHKLQRKGWLARDCQRMINQQRNIFAACMVAMGDADAMVTGLTRSYHVAMNELVRVLDTAPDATLFGISLMIAGGHTVFLADTAVHVSPTPKQIADIAVHTAATARQMGHHPRVAILSFSSFGHPMAERAESVRGAMALLDEMQVDFEYDGEMSPSIALDKALMDRVYPFCRLSGPANVLIMPGLNAGTIAPQLLHKLGNATVIGPLLTGLEHSAQIVPIGTTVSNMVNMAALAAYGAIKRKEK